MAVAVDVYLVRHAIAEERDAARWPDDSLRPLTAEGAESFRQAARGLRRIVPEVETVLASRYVRAWQTAEILEREAGWPAPERCEALEGNPDPEEARAVILALRGRGSVALVGHDPHLSRLASLLLTGDPDGMRLELKKGGVVHLALEPDEEATASLHASVTPKALRRRADDGSSLDGDTPGDRTVLAVDVGGSHVKLLISPGEEERRRFVSGPDLTPQAMVEGVLAETADWSFDVVSVGIPAPVHGGRVVSEPINLGPGWVGFDFERRSASRRRSSTTPACRRSAATRAGRCCSSVSAPGSARR